MNETPGSDLPSDISTPATLAAGEVVTGVVNPEFDTDWWRVDLLGGVTYEFSQVGDFEAAEPLFDPLFTLFDADGAFVTDDDDGGEGLNSLLRFRPEADGVFFAEAGAFSFNTGAYRLGLDAVLDLTDALEASFVDAETDMTLAPLTDGATVSLDDLAAERTTLAVTLGPDFPSVVGSVALAFNGVDVRVENVEPYAAFGNRGDDFFAGPPQSLFDTVAATNTLTLDVFAERDARGDRLGEAVFTFDLQDDAPQTAPDAPNIVVDDERRGMIDFRRDIDVYTVALEAGSAYEVTVDVEDGASPFDLSAVLDLGGVTPGVPLAETFLDAGRPSILTPSVDGSVTVRIEGFDPIGYTVSVAEKPVSDTGLLVVLVDSSTNEIIEVVDDGDVFSAAELLDRAATIAALPIGDAADAIGSVTLDLNDGLVTRTENVAPYALFGDANGDYFAPFAAPQPGATTVELTAFSDRRGQGEVLETLSRTFTILDDLPQDVAGDASTTATLRPGDFIGGLLESPIDEDWFRIDAEADTLYRIFVEPDVFSFPTLDEPSLTLVDADGDVLATQTGAFFGAELAFAASEDGPVFAAVAAGDVDQFGSYNVFLAAEAIAVI